MEITEIRAKAAESSAEHSRLKAFVAVTFDDSFVVRDLKVLEGNKGFFLSMPSRKVQVHCPACKVKNNFQARYCQMCGKTLPTPDPFVDDEGKQILYQDIAHPVNQKFRRYLEGEVIDAYKRLVDYTPDLTRVCVQCKKLVYLEAVVNGDECLTFYDLNIGKRLTCSPACSEVFEKLEHLTSKGESA